MSESHVAGRSPGMERLLQWSYYGFLLSLSISMFFSNAFFYLIVILVLPGIWRKKHLEHAGILLPFGLLSLWAALASWWGPELSAGLMQNKWPHILIFLALLNTQESSPGWRISWYLLGFTNGLLLVFAPVVTMFELNWPVFRRLASWAVRYSGTFTVSIAYATFLVFILLLGLVWLLEREKKHVLRGLGWGGWLLCLFALLLTTSRTGWLALAVCLVGLAVGRPRLRLPVVLAIVILLGAMVVPGIRELAPVAAVRQRIEATMGGYSSGRDVIWRVGWQLFRESPLIGQGTGGVGARYNDLVKTLPDVPAERRGMHYDELHNQYLQILAEWGLVGFTLYLWLLIALLRPFWQRLRFRPQDNAAIVGLLLVLAQIVSGLFQCSFFYANIGRLFWFLIALMLVEMNEERQAVSGERGA